MAFGVVRDGVGIVGDVCLELAVTFSERLDVRIPGLDAFRVGDKVVDAGNGRTDVAVPQEPLDAPQRPVDSFCFLPVVAVDGKALDVLPQHRDAHGDVAPVEHVLGAGATGIPPCCGCCPRRLSRGHERNLRPSRR